MKKNLVLGMIFFLVLVTSVQAQRTLHFAGYDWVVKQGYGGPGPNNWDDESSAVFVDEAGLHLRVLSLNDKWYSSEVYLPTSLGYCTYEFEVASDVSVVDTSLVGAVFLYQDDTHEIDVEFSRWHNEVKDNAQYVVQPFEVNGNMNRFMLLPPQGNVVQRIIWEPKMITFVTLENGKIVQQWQYDGANNFAPGKERVHVNFWQYKGLAPSDLLSKEFVVKNFTFTPRDESSEICQMVKMQKGKPIEKGFFSGLAKKLKEYFGN